MPESSAIENSDQESRNAVKSVSRVYSLYVDANTPNDIIGALAYAHHTRRLISWIEEYQAKNSRPPSDQELSAFFASSTSPEAVASYRDTANKQCQVLFDIYTAERIQAGSVSAYNDLVGKQFEHLCKKIDEQKKAIDDQNKILGFKGLAGGIVKDVFTAISAAGCVGLFVVGGVMIGRICGWLTINIPLVLH